MRTSWILAVALCAALSAAATAAPPPIVVDWLPDPDAPGLAGSTITEEGPGYAIRVQRLDQTQRRAFLAARVGAEVDPFASPPGAAPRYLTFVVEIENRSDGTLQFQPQNSWLVTNRDAVHYPIGLGQLRTGYRSVRAEMPGAYERSAPVMLAESRSIGPGERIDGLLVYKIVPPRTKRFRVEIQLVSSTGDVVRFSAPYRRPPKPRARSTRR